MDEHHRTRRPVPGTGCRFRGHIAMLAALLAVPCYAYAGSVLLDTRIEGVAGATTYSVSIPVVDQSGSSLAADRVKAVLAAGSLAELATIRAERISIPRLTITVTEPQGLAGSSLAFTDIELRDVGNGQAATMAIGSIVLGMPWGESRLHNIAARNVKGGTQLLRHGMNPEQRPGVIFEDMSFDVPHSAYPGGRVGVGILSLEASLAAFHNSIPTSFDVEGMGVRFDVPAAPDTPMLAALRTAGLVRIDGTFRLAAEWNERQNTISLLEASVTTRDVGGVFLAGEVAKAGKALYSTDPAEAQAALSGLTIRFVTASIRDSGLRDLLAASIVKPDKDDPGERLAVLARIVAQTAFGILYPSDDAGAVGAALKRFIAEGLKSIEVTVQAKTEPGIDLIDILDSGGNLPDLLQRLRIDAEVN